jgi:Rho-binding antiterminator
MSDERTRYEPIACELHDYIEIACLYRYRLLIEPTDGDSFEATAVTTRNTNGEEFLVLAQSEGPAEVRLDRLRAITALDAGAKFSRVLLRERADDAR